MKIIPILLIAFLAMASASNSPYNMIVYIYGSDKCSNCLMAVENVRAMFPLSKVVYFNIENESSLTRLIELYEVAGIRYGVLPVMIFIVNGEIRGLIFGLPEFEMWREIKRRLLNFTVSHF